MTNPGPAQGNISESVISQKEHVSTSSSIKTSMGAGNPTSVTQPDSNTGKPSSKKPMLIVVLLSLLVLVPLCIILLVVAIIAINPTGSVPSPTPTTVTTKDSFVEDTITPSEDLLKKPSNTIVVQGEDWTSFEYSLPDGQKISGYAPFTHAFGNDYSSSSRLGNYFSFGIIEGESSLRLQFLLSEGFYGYYRDNNIGSFQREDGVTVYKFIDPEVENSIYYTDSYETTSCAEYENFLLNEPDASNNYACGTGTMFGHGYLVTCDYQQADRLNSTWICDEIIKRIDI